MATKTLMTAEEFVRMDAAETESFELVDGELISMSSAIVLHGVIRDRAIRRVGEYFDGHPIGGAVSETDCRINADTVRRPDLSIFLAERWRQVDFLDIPMPFAPDIAVEVLSPSEHIMEVNRKVRDYFSAGSQEVWLLDHAICEVHVRTKSGAHILSGSDQLETGLLPGFSVSVAALLAGR